MIEAYKDPKTDFHEIVRGMLGFTGHRTPVKTVNFGMLYGMGKDKLTRTLTDMGLDIDAMDFLELYHSKFPEARQMLDKYSNIASRNGEVRTILNRRNTFNYFEPRDAWGDIPALPYKKAIKEYGPNIVRAGTHKALNRVLQGSAADLMKKGMVEIYKAGIFDKIGYPFITVHDELDQAYHEDYRQLFDEQIEIMQNCIKLKVPILADMKVGSNWGEVG